MGRCLSRRVIVNDLEAEIIDLEILVVDLEVLAKLVLEVFVPKVCSDPTGVASFGFELLVVGRRWVEVIVLRGLLRDVFVDLWLVEAIVVDDCLFSVLVVSRRSVVVHIHDLWKDS